MPIATKDKIKIYIAGPFFNPKQLSLITAIEDDFTKKEIDFYSPRLHPGNEPCKPIDNETAKKIFESNVNAIHDCTHVLAVMCWLGTSTHVLPDILPKHLGPPVFKELGEGISILQQCRVEAYDQYIRNEVPLESGEMAGILQRGLHKFLNFMIPPANLPDTGTVFEMGYAASESMPIIGYTNTKPGEGKLNIMLTQACRGVICGSENFDRAFKGGEIVWDEIKPWTGKNL